MNIVLNDTLYKRIIELNDGLIICYNKKKEMIASSPIENCQWYYCKTDFGIAKSCTAGIYIPGYEKLLEFAVTREQKNDFLLFASELETKIHCQNISSFKAISEVEKIKNAEKNAKAKAEYEELRRYAKSLSEAKKKNDPSNIIKESMKKNQSYNPLLVGAIKKAGEMLSKYEKLIAAFSVNASIYPVNGNYKVDFFKLKGKTLVAFVITDKRIYFVDSLFGNETRKQMYVEDIQSIDEKSTVFGVSKMRILGLTDMFVLDSTKSELKLIRNALDEARMRK